VKVVRHTFKKSVNACSTQLAIKAGTAIVVSDFVCNTFYGKFK